MNIHVHFHINTCFKSGFCGSLFLVRATKKIYDYVGHAQCNLSNETVFVISQKGLNCTIGYSECTCTVYLEVSDSVSSEGEVSDNVPLSSQVLAGEAQQ